MTLLNRIGSIIVDHIIMTSVIVVVGIPLLILSFFLQRYFDVRMNWIIGVLLLIIYLNKDYLRAKSPAKRIIGLQVVNNSNGKPASRLKCFIRNLTIVVWPIEIILTFFSKQRRLGDLIANTKIIESEKEPLKNILAEIKNAAQQ